MKGKKKTVQSKKANAVSELSRGAVSDTPLYYVGIGASAGGLEALQTFFDHIPADSGLAFVVVQHLSPDYKSLMVELLSKHTQMEVLRVEDGMTIQPNAVYLIPPRKMMAVRGGNLYLSEQLQRHGLNLPIDVFFRSLAEDQGERAIGVILSGTGSDGTRGIRAIKEEGGTVLVQDEESAKFDGMPKSAIATGLADFILPPDIMPDELLKFIHHPYIAERKEPADILTDEVNGFTRIFRILNRKANVDFTHYKPSTVVRRIERRMGIVQVHSLDDYLAYIHRNPKEVTALFKDLLIGVTKFFRDQAAFQVIRDTVIPSIFENVGKRESKTVRVWVAGCSTGEEAYSVAMLIQDYMDIHKISFEVKVFATDIDREAIEFAGAGFYPESIIADVDVEFVSKYFEKKAKGYQVRRNIREMVIFALQNLAKDPPFTKVDLISCRNLLIYLQPILQQKVLSVFNYALMSDGYLFLGSSETVADMGDAFHPLDQKNRIYRHTGKGTLPIKGDMFLSLSKEAGLPSAYKSSLLHAQDTKAAGKQASQDQYYQALIRVLAPAVLVINEEQELIQSFGSVQEYLTIPEGDMSLDVLLMLPRELSLAASAALHKVRKDKHPVVYSDIRIKQGNAVRSVSLKVDFIPEIKAKPRFFLLILEDLKPVSGFAESENNRRLPPDALMEQRISDLEQEIQFTRENLQATIEELQTSNEELQATNEELLAANEELQSTNEELQSVNEELNTVNSEYQLKNAELTELNNDMKNLMESTDIGTIFLGRDLCIRKFTPAVTRCVNLLEQDIGRPLSDLSVPLFGNILADISTVISAFQPVERRVSDGAVSFLLRVMPFKNEKDEFDGIVITLVDITIQADAEKSLRLKSEFLESLLESTPSAQIMVDEKGKILFVNKQAEVFLGFSKVALLRMRMDSPRLKFTDIDGNPVTADRGPLAAITASKVPVEKYILFQKRKGGQEIVFSVSGNPVFNSENKIGGAVFKFEKMAYKI